MDGECTMLWNNGVGGPRGQKYFSSVKEALEWLERPSTDRDNSKATNYQIWRGGELVRNGTQYTGSN